MGIPQGMHLFLVLPLLFLHGLTTEYEAFNGKKPDCLKMWFSNNVVIPGPATLPENMTQPEVTCIGQVGHHDTAKEFPWNAPGRAPLFSPCGTLGGNPEGCPGEQSG